LTRTRSDIADQRLDHLVDAFPGDIIAQTLAVAGEFRCRTAAHPRRPDCHAIDVIDSCRDLDGACGPRSRYRASPRGHRTVARHRDREHRRLQQPGIDCGPQRGVYPDAYSYQTL